MIYSDERKERLKAIEERARRELGLLPEEQSKHEDLRGAFSGSVRHLKQQKERPAATHNGTLAVILLILLILFCYMITS